MKKIINCVLVGAVMLGLTACAGQAGTAGVDTSTEAVQSEAETTEEVTTETSEESTAETSGETTVLTSEEPTQNDDTVIAERYLVAQSGNTRNDLREIIGSVKLKSAA